MIISWIYVSWRVLVFFSFLRLVHKQVTKVSFFILNFASGSNLKALGSRALCLHF